MSTILKALDRLERERRAARARPGDAAGSPPGAPAPLPSRRGRAAVGVCAALLAGAVLGAGALKLWPGASPGEAAGEGPASPVAAAGPAEVAALAPAPSPPLEPAFSSDPVAAAEPEPAAELLELPEVPELPAPELAESPPPPPAGADSPARELPPAALASEVAVVEPSSARAPLPRDAADEAPVAVVGRPPGAREGERAPAPAPPEFFVARTVWHPLRERRLAVLEVKGEQGVRELREGDRLGPLVVRQIDPSSVLFEHDGHSLRRRVGK